MKKKFPSISVSSGIIATKVRYIDINGIFLKTIDKKKKWKLFMADFKLSIVCVLWVFICVGV